MSEKQYNPVGWFEIPVQEMARAKSFYESVFQVELFPLEMPGMEMVVWPMAEDKSGSSGALLKMEGLVPNAQPGLSIYFSCEDVSVELARVEGAGGKPVMEKTPIGEHGFIAAFYDTEGNYICLHSRA